MLIDFVPELISGTHLTPLKNNWRNIWKCHIKFLSLHYNNHKNLNKMKQNFVKECLEISVSRGNENTLHLNISSDFSGSNRKSRLYVDGKRMADQVERVWKLLKSKKLLKMRLSFGEIDWYDDLTDIYTTPVITIERGQKKARIGEREHGSIPKDWDINLSAVFADTTTHTAITDVIKRTLEHYYSSDLDKEFRKKLKPVLQKVKTSCFVSTSS